MYSIDITETANKFLDKVPKKDREGILKKLYSIRFEPFHFVKRLEGTKLWRLRIQDYRAVLEIIIKGNKIIVVRIGHRKDIYKRL
ncbi:type II toxin-antitoxin system RelE/ParE family toxin [Candidatus Woesearchaeota archaeon]|nr:type II toxin-antitoxin system RelE/ParE family toxin [Candidatus Woesearchaeota archaeon]